MQEQWETWQNIQQLCEAADVRVSKDQLERWRSKGLLPKARQVGKGRGAGSETRYPIGTANQAIAIVRLLKIKEKFSFVGWQLWMAGYNVDEHYWRPFIENAILLLRRAPAFVRLLEIRNALDDKTIYDQFEPHKFSQTPFAKGIARLNPDMRALAFGLLGEVVKGQFSGFDRLAYDDLNISEHAFTTLLGATKNSKFAKIFEKLGFASQLELQISAVSKTFAELWKKSISLERTIPIEVRSEFQNALAISGQLIRKFPELKKSPVGSFQNELVSDENVQAIGIVFWHNFRKQGTIMSHPKIAELLIIATTT